MKKISIIVLSFILSVFFPEILCFDQIHAMNSEKKQEIIDRVLAVVNGEIITLTDVKIYFIVSRFPDDRTEKKENRQNIYLEQLIEQKLVLQMTKEISGITEADVNRFKNKIDVSDRREEFYESLSEMGLSYEDIRAYVKERLLFERIITHRFNRAASVSIKEIEQYYQEVYIPRRLAEGHDPEPMVDILDEIETGIKKEKIDKQVKEWIANLKEEADIEIKNPPPFFE